jgi:HK97 gp10 family phage protein
VPDILITGTDQFGSAMTAMVLKVDIATKVATGAAADLLRTTMVKKLSEKSHPPGTPTPSAPGEPPAWVSGRLARSVERDEPREKGFGNYAASVGPDTEYARIQEEGGETGRGHATHLPARPYLAPSVAESAPRMQEIFGERLQDAIFL